MLGPTSPLVIAVLILVAVALMLGILRWQHWAARSVAVLTVLALGVTLGIVSVNDYFGYYTSWADAYAGTVGSAGSAQGAALDTRGRSVGPAAHGQLRAIEMSGRSSHINRRGFVYLPPQYFERRYRSVRFPVVELLHGTPGGPWNWRDQLHIAATVDKLDADRAIGPMVYVMPQISVGQSQECLNYGNVLDDTYVAKDVPADIRHKYRASRDPAQWALFGYSSGGYCAVNLALRHRAQFGAAASMDGYYWPLDGPAGRRLAGDAASTVANDPLAAAERLPSGSVPMPQFWISAGSGDADDLAGARDFVTALQRLERVTFVIQPGARHNFYSWRDQAPRALVWIWKAISTPDLRVDFPAAGPTRSVAIPVDPHASRPSRHCRHSTRPVCLAKVARTTTLATVPTPS